MYKQLELILFHDLRRSATLLANAETDIITVKRCQGGWKSSIVTEGYTQDLVSNKSEIAKKIRDSVKQNM